MATNRDAQTLLAEVRKKWPKYEKTDDVTLLSLIQKKYPQYNDISLSSIPKTENLLQRVIKSSRMGPMGGTSIVAALPSSGEEAVDLAKVAGRQIPMTRGQEVGIHTMGPFGVGVNMAGTKKLDPIIPEPTSDYGKTLETEADIAQWIPLGSSVVGGATSGIKNFFSKGDLPQKIQQVKGSIYDLIKKTPENVKGKVGTLFNEFRKEFGARLSTMKWNLNNSHFEEALQKTADELGTSRIQGTDGATIASLAEQFRNGGYKTYDPTEVQALTGKLLGNMDSLAQAKFYRNFMDVLERQDPAFAQLKRDYAPVFDIAKNSKRLKSGAIRDVASDKIGPESLADVAESEQMLYPEGGGPVEKASAKGDELRTLTSKLEKIEGRRKGLGKFIKASPYVGGGLGLTWLLSKKK